MKNSKITLESTAIEFNKWREKRKAGDPIPKQLWDMVAKIYEHYPHTALCQKLNLKVAQLKSQGLMPDSQDFDKESSALKPDCPSSPFIHVPPAVAKDIDAGVDVKVKANKNPTTPKPARPTSSGSPEPVVETPEPELPSIEIHRPDGVRIIFKHHDNAQLAAVLQQLINP